MNIELGKYYVNRAGQKVGPVIPNSNAGSQLGMKSELYPFAIASTKETYTSSGRAGFDTTIDHEHDLIKPLIDLTTITTAFGLLDVATEIALLSHGGPYEWYTRCGVWETIITPAWEVNTIYRVATAPVIATVEQDFWMDATGHLHHTQHNSDLVPVTRVATTVNGVLDLARGYTISPRQV